MKLFYIANSRIPTEKAHGYQIAKMCEEFADAGLEVELLVPTRKNSIEKNLFEFYNLKNNFKVKLISVPDFFKHEKYLGGLAFYLQSLAFFIKLLLEKFDKETVIFTRNPEIIWQFSIRGEKTIFEAHGWPENNQSLFKFFLRGADKIVCNSHGTEKEFKKSGLQPTLVAPNGVDLKKFLIPGERGEFRRELGLPNNKKIILYLGHFYNWKGVDTAIATAYLMKEKQNIAFVFVGGSDKDVTKYKKLAAEKAMNNVLFCGFQEKKIIPKYLKCADVLLLPNSACSNESVHYTSPIKMFEYMASGQPIVASELPSIREILNENNCLFFEPDNAADLAKKIKQALNDPVLAEKLSTQARQDVEQYDWDKRARKIIDFISEGIS